MKKIIAGIVSLLFLISMVLSTTALSFADDYLPKNEENVSVATQETIDETEEEALQPEEELVSLEDELPLDLEEVLEEEEIIPVEDELFLDAEEVLEEDAEQPPLITEVEAEEPVLLSSEAVEELVPLESEAQEIKLPQETRDASENVVPDEVLRKAINKKLGLGDDNTAYVTQAQVESLTGTLSYNGYDTEKITSIEGLQYAKNLDDITLNSNKISDLTPLSELESTNLYRLNLNSNKNINSEDIARLSGLSSLRELYIDYTNVSDLSAISHLNLKVLYASYTKLGDDDLSTIADFENLESLDLNGNGLEDISPLSEMNKLKYFKSRDNNISDVSPLGKIQTLQSLFLPENNISDISSLSDLTNLYSLALTDNNVSDITALSGLVELKRLYLGHNNISNINALSSLDNLTTLHLYENNISDIPDLSGLDNLTMLLISDNHIIDASPLEQLPSLTHIACGGQTVEQAIGLPYTFSSMIIGTDGNIVELADPQNGIVNGDGTYSFKYGYSEATFNWVDYDSGGELTHFDGTLKVVKGWTITSTANGHGIIDPVGNVAVERNTDKTFNFTPDPGYEIDKIFVDNVEQEISNSYTFTNVTEDHTIEVIFKKEAPSYTITATAGENGSISPSGTVTVKHGDYQSFRITPDAGYKIKDVTVDGVSYGAPKVLILQSVMEDKTVEVTFEEDPVNVTSGADQSIVEGSDTIEDIRISGELEEFESLWVDGRELTKGTDYTVKSGSTIVTFAPEYLKKLQVGTHYLEFRYTGNRVATTTLKVTAKGNNNGSNSGNGGGNGNGASSGSSNTGDGKSSNSTDRESTTPTSPNTGDSYPTGIAMIALISMMALVVINKRQNG